MKKAVFIAAFLTGAVLTAVHGQSADSFFNVAHDAFKAVVMRDAEAFIEKMEKSDKESLSPMLVSALRATYYCDKFEKEFSSITRENAIVTVTSSMACIDLIAEETAALEKMNADKELLQKLYLTVLTYTFQLMAKAEEYGVDKM
jgi:hypothetical protein